VQSGNLKIIIDPGNSGIFTFTGKSLNMYIELY
jgi:hypothetical protein